MMECDSLHLSKREFFLARDIARCFGVNTAVVAVWRGTDKEVRETGSLMKESLLTIARWMA